MDKLAEADLGQTRKFLPLNQAGRITHGNSAVVDWLSVCPAVEGSETVLIGNPPFKGSKHQSPAQRDDMRRVFSGVVANAGELDYVAIWFLKAAYYAVATGTRFAFVSTNSIVQGASVSTLWPHLLKKLEIKFAHRSFKWSNLATKNAGVVCVIVGLGPRSEGAKRLFDGDTVRDVELIGPYLAPNVATIVFKRSKPIAPNFEPMIFGNMPNNGDALLLDRTERDELLRGHPEIIQFVRRIFGSQELMKGIERWCIWIEPDDVSLAQSISPLMSRFERVRRKRLESSDAAARKMAQTPWSFREQNVACSHTIIIPGAASEDRNWLPVDLKSAPDVTSKPWAKVSSLVLT